MRTCQQRPCRARAHSAKHALHHRTPRQLPAPSSRVFEDNQSILITHRRALSSLRRWYHDIEVSTSYPEEHSSSLAQLTRREALVSIRFLRDPCHKDNTISMTSSL